MTINKLQKYRDQLTKCCKPIIRQTKVEPKPKTGIERQAEETQEVDMLESMYRGER